MSVVAWVIVGIGAFLAFLFLVSSIYVVRQWEKVAVIRFGRIIKIVVTGLHFKVPMIDSIRRVDLRRERQQGKKDCHQ